MVLQDGDVSPEDFLEQLVVYTNGEYVRRLDMVLDSCFSGAFISTFLVNALSNCANKIWPCSLFSTSMHDEYAWEYPKYSHGIWTAAFLQQINAPFLNQNRISLVTRVLLRRFLKLEAKELYQGGVAYMTEGNQHSFLYENGLFKIDGLGSFALPDTNSINVIRLQDMLESFRKT